MAFSPSIKPLDAFSCFDCIILSTCGRRSVEAEAYLSFPGPHPSSSGPSRATVKSDGFISLQWPRIPLLPPVLGKTGAWGPVSGLRGPVQTTVPESGPEWVPGGPPSLPPGEAQEQALPLATRPGQRFPGLVAAALVKVKWEGPCSRSSSFHTQCDINKKINSVASSSPFPPSIKTQSPQNLDVWP